MKNYMKHFKLEGEMQKVMTQMDSSNNEYVTLKKALSEIEKDILENGYERLRIIKLSYSNLNPDNYEKAKSFVENIKDELCHHCHNSNDTLHSIRQIRKVIKVCLRHECYIQSLENIIDSIITNANIISSEIKIS